VIRGSPESPAVVALPLTCAGGKSALSAERAIFAWPVKIDGAKSCRVERSSFLAGLELAAARPEEEAAGERIRWLFELCEFRAPRAGEAALKLSVEAPEDLLELAVVRCNIRGPVTGSVAWGGRADLSRNHWARPVSEMLSGLDADGTVELEPAQAEALAEAGAGVPVRELIERAGLRMPEERGDVYTSARGGYELVVPEGWRPAGTGMLLAPPPHTPATRMTIRTRTGPFTPELARRGATAELRRAGASELKVADREPLDFGEVKADCFRLDYRAGLESWARRVAVWRRAGTSFVLTLNAPAEDIDALAPAFETVARSLRPAGK
jgi:hypothetical protein